MESRNSQKKTTEQSNRAADNQTIKIVNYPNQSYWNANPYTPGFYGSGLYWTHQSQDLGSNQTCSNQAFEALATTLQNIEIAVQKIAESQIALQRDVARIKEKLNLDSSSSDLENRVIAHDTENILPPESTHITKMEHVDEDIDVDIENDEDPATRPIPLKNTSPTLSTRSTEISPSPPQPQKDIQASDDDVPLSRIFSSTEKQVSKIPKSQRRRNIKPTMDDSALNSETKQMREREQERRIAIKKHKTFLPNIPPVEKRCVEIS